MTSQEPTYDVEKVASTIGDALQFLKAPATTNPDPSQNDVISQVTAPSQQAAAPQHGDPLVYGGGGTTSYTGDGNQDDFYKSVLSGIGAPVTDANLTFMRAWNQAEGMPAGQYNPWATTQGAAGATAINSVGVRAYPDAQTGINATVQTLQNGNYQGILDALQQGTDPMAAAYAVANSPWGTGTGVIRVLGGS